MRDPAIERDRSFGWWDEDDERAWLRCMCCKTEGRKKPPFGLLCHGVRIPDDFRRKHRTYEYVKVVTCESAYCQAKLEELGKLEALRTAPIPG